MITSGSLLVYHLSFSRHSLRQTRKDKRMVAKYGTKPCYDTCKPGVIPGDYFHHVELPYINRRDSQMELQTEPNKQHNDINHPITWNRVVISGRLETTQRAEILPCNKCYIMKLISSSFHFNNIMYSSKLPKLLTSAIHFIFSYVPFYSGNQFQGYGNWVRISNA